MSLINIQNLTFSYDGEPPIFDNVTFQIDTAWKTGLIGRNGKGKTTFLKLLTGEYEYKGIISSNVNFSYFPFTVKNEALPTLQILQKLSPTAMQWEIEREISLLKIDSEVLYRPFKNLSGGEQTKLLLASLFLNEGTFLLIDEPTNHLDFDGRQAVSEYLKKKKGFILVSHDRAFLDRCVDHIISINKSKIEIQSGNFSSWQTNFERRQSFELTQNKKLEKNIKELSEAEKRTSRWADKTEASKYQKQASGLKADRGYIGHKAAKMMKRAKENEIKKNRAIQEKSELLKDFEINENLKLFPLIFRSSRILSFSQVEIFYDKRKICGPVNLEIQNGDRVALEGKNGSGKSSLLKMIIGEDINHSGIFSAASGLIVSYLPQTSKDLRGNLSAFAKENNIDETLFKTILKKTNFSREDFDRDMSEYSSGQKKKVLIAKSLCEKAHLYIWDEPLNFIDIYSRIQIEKLISEFLPTMIFVEHDKVFREKTATKIIKL